MSIREKRGNSTEDYASKTIKEIDKYKKEIEIYQKKIKGYEILNTLFKESVDKCKNQEILIKLMNDRIKEVEKKLEENRNTSSINLKSLALNFQEQSNQEFPIFSSNIKNFGSDEKDRNDQLRKKDTETITEVVFQRNDNDTNLKQLSRHSSSSFVKVTESQAGEDDLHFSVNSRDDDGGDDDDDDDDGGDDDDDGDEDNDDNDVIKTYDMFVDDKVMTMIEAKEEKTPTLEAELTTMMKKLKFIDLSSSVEGQSLNFFTDISSLTERMLQFYGRSKIIQGILEKLEKENKNLKAQLNEGIKQEVEPKDNEKIEMQQKIGDLISCKQALLKMMSQKDEQIVHHKRQIKFLASNLDKSKLSFNRSSTCLQENTKRWQKDYKKLEEQLTRMKEEREHDREERHNLRSEVRHLRMELEESKKLHQQLHGRHDSSETEVLKQQIVVYAEDFNNERKDREKAKASMESLQKKFDALSLKFSNLNYENMKLKEKYHDLLNAQQLNPNMTNLFGATNPPPISTGVSSAPLDESWQCQRCTYINNAWMLYCAACERPNF